MNFPDLLGTIPGDRRFFSAPFRQVTGRRYRRVRLVGKPGGVSEAAGLQLGEFGVRVGRLKPSHFGEIWP